MLRGRIVWRALSALVVLFAAVPQATPLALFAASRQAATATCGCNGRVCCCTPKQRGGGERAPCHGGPAQKPIPGAPSFRCNHTLPGASLPSRPAVLVAQVFQRWTPPASLAPATPVTTARDGFRRIDAPPPRALFPHA